MWKYFQLTDSFRLFTGLTSFPLTWVFFPWKFNEMENNINSEIIMMMAMIMTMVKMVKMTMKIKMVMMMMVKMFKPCFPFSCPVSAPLVTAFSGRLGVQFRRKRGKGANQGDRATKQSTTWALLQLQRVLPWNNRWSSTSFFFLLPWNNCQCWSTCHCCAAMNNPRSTQVETILTSKECCWSCTAVILGPISEQRCWVWNMRECERIYPSSWEFN